ncbi:MAG: hypothetical protein ACREBC_00035 [Pyrinomonadaceae bacterium]
MKRLDIYYLLKPLIPRRLQIAVRRTIVHRKRPLYSDVWPIDEKAGKLPDHWPGWPYQKRFAVVLTHDVETAKGREQSRELVRLETNLGFRSAFNFVPERYKVLSELRHYLAENEFEVGVHDLTHDGKLYRSRNVFNRRAVRINHYLKEWESVGFRSAAMHHNLAWIHDLNIEYDSSTFDTDPFEAQPDGVRTIFPLWVPGYSGQNGYVELPYTLPQDFTVFVIMQEKSIDIWKQKFDWIAENGGMALLITHPDYMNFGGQKQGREEYPVEYYIEFLEYMKSSKFEGQYWHVLPRDIARFWMTLANHER